MGGSGGGQGGINGDRKRLDSGNGHTMQDADDVLLSCTLEIYMVLQTSVTPIISIIKKEEWLSVVYKVDFKK